MFFSFPSCQSRTVFALWDVAAFVASLGVGGVAPRTDSIPVRVPAVVQLQTVGRRRSPSETNRVVLTEWQIDPHNVWVVTFSLHAHGGWINWSAGLGLREKTHSALMSHCDVCFTKIYRDLDVSSGVAQFGFPMRLAHFVAKTTIQMFNQSNQTIFIYDICFLLHYFDVSFTCLWTKLGTDCFWTTFSHLFNINIG